MSLKDYWLTQRHTIYVQNFDQNNVGLIDDSSSSMPTSLIVILSITMELQSMQFEDHGVCFRNIQVLNLFFILSSLFHDIFCLSKLQKKVFISLLFFSFYFDLCILLLFYPLPPTKPRLALTNSPYVAL